MVGDEVFEMEEGGWHLRPHGIVQTFWNAGNKPAIFIDFYPNQNFEFCLDEINKLFLEFSKKEISIDSREGRKKFDEIQSEWGIVMYWDQRKPIMDKYGLKG